MYGKDAHSLEPYLLYSSSLGHNANNPGPIMPTPIQKPRSYPKHSMHGGFMDKQSIWHPAEHGHSRNSSLGCVLEEDEGEGEETDDSKSVRNPGLRDSGYSSGSASSEDGEPDTPREGCFPTSKRQMFDTHRFIKDFRAQQQSLPLPMKHDNNSNGSDRSDSWPSFRRTPNHVTAHRPPVAEEPFLIYSTPSPTNCLTPPVEQALIYSTFSPKGPQSRNSPSPVYAFPPAISPLPSGPFRSMSNFHQPQPQEPIKTKYTSSFDPFAAEFSVFSPSPGEVMHPRINRSRFA